MSDADQGATGTQADPGTQPPAGNPATQADAGTVEQPKEPESISLEAAKSLRSENRTLRERLKAAEESEKARTDAGLSDLEKATKRNADLERQIADSQRSTQERVLRYASEAAATSMGMKPDLVYRLLDHAAIEYDDEGQPKNLREQITSLAKTYPELTGAKGGSADGGARGATGITKEALASMKPDEINARWEEVQKTLSAK